jgi:hypothetical protein
VGEAVKLGEDPFGFGDFRQNWRTGGLGEQRSFAESTLQPGMGGRLWLGRANARV